MTFWNVVKERDTGFPRKDRSEQFLESGQGRNAVECEADADQITLLRGMQHGPCGIEGMDGGVGCEVMEFVKQVGKRCQLMAGGLFVAICGGEVSGDAVDAEAGLEDRLHGLYCPSGQDAKAPHAGIHLEVDRASLRGRAGVKRGFLRGGKGGDEAAPCDFPVFRGKGGTEEQDRHSPEDLSELERFTQRGDRKDLDATIEDPDDLLEAVAIGIGLHDGHDAGLARQFSDGFQVMAEGATVDLDPGAVGKGRRFIGHSEILRQSGFLGKTVVPGESGSLPFQGNGL